jgi:uncharacterized membrane protein
MESRVKLLGHAIHPMLIVFPLGLFATAVIFDVITLATNREIFTVAAQYMIGAGVIGGLLAAVFGLIDYLRIPGGTRAKTIGLWHGLLNVAVTGLFVGSYILRETEPANPSVIALALSFTGAAVALVGGWLGGELVERLGVSVDHGANLNAPSSLKRPHPQPL